MAHGFGGEYKAADSDARAGEAIGEAEERVEPYVWRERGEEGSYGG